MILNSNLVKRIEVNCKNLSVVQVLHAVGCRITNCLGLKIEEFLHGQKGVNSDGNNRSELNTHSRWILARDRFAERHVTASRPTREHELPCVV